MVQSPTPFEQTQLAAIIIPIIGLVVNYALESIDSDTNIVRRSWITFLTLGALIPASIGFLLVLVGPVFNFVVSQTTSYLLISGGFVIALSISALIYEVTEGLEEDDRKEQILFFIFIVIGLIVIWQIMSGI